MPWCFKGSEKLSTKYASNTKAWKTLAIFSKWLKELDDKMHHQKRRLCLLLDNCTADRVLELPLKSVQLH